MSVEEALATLIERCDALGARLVLTPPSLSTADEWSVQVDMANGFTVYRDTLTEAVEWAADSLTEDPS